MRLIDADRVNKTIDKFIGYLDEDMILRIKMKISAIPTVEIPHGEWIWKEWATPMSIISYRKCSVCGIGMEGSTEYDFCPNCGADMRKRGEAE